MASAIWDDEANDKNESGANQPTSWPPNHLHTGCKHNGTESFVRGTSRALGTSNVRAGRPNSSGSGNGPISSDYSGSPFFTLFFYGLSGVFKVGPAPGETIAAVAPEVTIVAVAWRVTYADGENASFTLRRTGETTAALTVTVALTQDKPFLEDTELSREVTIPVGAASAPLDVGWAAFMLPDERVAVSTESATATFNQDFSPIGNLTVVFQAGDYTAVGNAWRAEKSVVVTILDDVIDEPDEEFLINLRRAAGLDYRVLLVAHDGTGPGNQASTILIVDNDGDQEMLIVWFDASSKLTRYLREGGSYYLHVGLDRASVHEVTIPLVVTYTGGATAADVTGVPASVTFGAGQRWSGVVLSGVDDTEVSEESEGFVVSFGTLPEGVEADSHWGPTATYKIVDNDSIIHQGENNATEEAPPAPLLADFNLVPSSHDGSSAFTFLMAFTEEVEITPEDLRDHALTVIGATVIDAERVDGRKDLWELTLQPSGSGPVSILTPLGRTCTEAGALCTADGRPLAGGIALQVPGPPPPQVNSPATGAPAVNGTVQVGETLTADTSGIADADGLSNAAFTYQWIRNDGTSDTDITDATDSTYTLAADDEGKTIKVKVSFTDDADNEETLTSAATASVTALPDPGSAPDNPDRPVGTAVFAGGVDLAWDDVPGPDSYDVQLYRNGQWIDLPGDGVEIAFYGAGAIISELDPASSLWFHVRAGNAHGSSDWSDYDFMAATNQYASGRRARPDNVASSGAPVINGTAQAGETVTADTAGIEDGNGLDRVQFRFQWVSHDGSADTDISGAADSSYTLAASDEGKTIKLRVAFTDRGGYAESLTSNATEAVGSAVQQQSADGQGSTQNSPATGAPGISGTAQVGETLTADTSGIADSDGLSNAAFTYQWIRNDGTSDTDITDATDSTYTLAADDEGKTIKVRVSFTDDGGNGEVLTSTATASVAARPNSPATGAPGISGTAQVGETLTAGTSGIADSEGLTNVSYSYQWVANDGTSDTDIPDTADSTYTLAAADKGKTIKVKVSFTDDAGYGETLTSAATATVDAAPNSPATGAPGISGTAQVGETLTADTSGIADSDGLSNAAFTYQWIRNDGTSDTDIPDTADSTYTLAAADKGKTIKVKVSFTDDAGYGETLTSAATATVDAAPNSPATGAPAVNGTVQVGKTLTADTSGIADADGLTGVSYSYQWIRIDWAAGADIENATGASYTLVDADEGQFIRVRVSFTDDADNEETLTSAATGEVSAAAPAEPPRAPRNLTGAANADGTVTLRWDASGDDTVTGYQILRRRPREGEKTLLVYVNGTGSTASEYTDRDVAPDVSYAYRVKAINAAGLSKRSKFVRVTPGQSAQNSPATGAPAISGAAQVGETLTADTSAVSDADGLSNAAFNYQWIRNDGTSDTDIQNATGSSYTLAADDDGKTIRVRVSFADDAGNGEVLSSAATDAVSPAVQRQQSNTPATEAPTINGTAQVGETLTADTSGISDTDGITGVSYSYQWVANDGTSDTDIPGAAGSIYTPAAADDGKTIKVRVSFIDDGGNGEVLTSAATDAVSPAVQRQQSNTPATGAPMINGTAQVGETLTADTSGISDTDGITGVSYSYQWIRNDGTSDTDIPGASSIAYALVDADQGKTVKVKVGFTDDAGNEETLTSAATAEMAAAAPTGPPGRPRNLTGAANSDGTVTLRWDAPDDDSVTGYQILRRRPREGEETLLVYVNDTGSTATGYTDRDVTPDVSYAYRVKAINAAGLSRRSKSVNVTPVESAGPLKQPGNGHANNQRDGPGPARR